MPESSAVWMMRTHSSSSVFPHEPNIIAPRQKALTSTPVRPSVRYSIWSLLVVALRQLRDQPGEESLRAARLHVHLSRSGEINYQTLTRQERGLPAADLADLVADTL